VYRKLENRLHWVQDVVFGEGHHRLRTSDGPKVIAFLKNLAISLIRLFRGPGNSISPPPDLWQDASNEHSNYSLDHPLKLILPVS
jgi:transposase